jgi:hypothetical protein
MSYRLFCLFCLTIFTLSGCGGKKEVKKLPLQPVTGKVMVNGKGTEKATLTFHPLTPINEPGKRSIIPTARVAADGTFKVGFYEATDGAPVGEYAITIEWPTFREEGGEEVAGPDRLQRRYATKQRPAAKFTVKEGENKIPDINLR